jgi:anti-sigma B factor antagonist
MDGRAITVLVADPDGTRTLSVIGDLDLGTAPVVERELHALSDAHAHIRVDVSALEFIDAAGLRTLIDATRQARRKGRRVELTGSLPRSLRRLVALTGVGPDLGL